MFFVFDWKYNLNTNLVQNQCQSCQFKLKFGPKADSNMQNSMVIFTFFFPAGTPINGQTWYKKSKLLVKLKFCI